MHTQYPKIEEDNELPKVLPAKQNLKSPENLMRFGSIVTTLPGLKPGQGVFPSGLRPLPYHLRNMHNLVSRIREDTTLQTLLIVKHTLNRNSAKSENWIKELCLDP
jgi:hypothetical protein